MLLNIKRCIFTSLLLVSTSALASVTTANFGGVSDGGSNFNQFNVSFGGVDINVAGWSDTAEQISGSTPTVPDAADLDPYIERAVDLDKNEDGWSMENVDEINGASCGGGNGSHSADNFGNNCQYQDYDFFLLSFSESVTLTEATYSWISDTTAETQVSVVALDGNGLAIDSNGNGNLQDNTWSNIQANQMLASDWAQMQFSGDSGHNYYTDFSGTGTGTAGNVVDIYSKFWLIGALNSVFGTDSSIGEYNDGMKLAGVSFKTVSPGGSISVPEPSSYILFAVALFGLQLSSRRKLK